MFGSARWDWISMDGSQSQIFPYLSSYRIPAPIQGIHSLPFFLELHRNPRKFSPSKQIPRNLSQIGQETEKSKQQSRQNPQKIRIKTKIMDFLPNWKWKNQSDQGAKTLKKIGIKAKILEFQAGIQANISPARIPRGINKFQRRKEHGKSGWRPRNDPRRGPGMSPRPGAPGSTWAGAAHLEKSIKIPELRNAGGV